MQIQDTRLPCILNSSQPDTSLHCNTMGMGLVYHVESVQLTVQLFCWHSFCPPPGGWPGRVNLCRCLNIRTRLKPTNGHRSQY